MKSNLYNKPLSVVEKVMLSPSTSDEEREIATSEYLRQIAVLESINFYEETDKGYSKRRGGKR